MKDAYGLFTYHPPTKKEIEALKKYHKEKAHEKIDIISQLVDIIDKYEYGGVITATDITTIENAVKLSGKDPDPYKRRDNLGLNVLPTITTPAEAARHYGERVECEYRYLNMWVTEKFIIKSGFIRIMEMESDRIRNVKLLGE
jgi:hypothetical protein